MSNKLIMGNMADLVVRELWGAYEHQHKQRVMQLIRVVGCYSEPLLFVEVSQTQPWMILHLNEAAVTVTGEGRHSIPQRASQQTMYLPTDEESSVSANLHSRLYGRPSIQLAGSSNMTGNDEEVLTELLAMCRPQAHGCNQQEVLGRLYRH